jgi:hypothetical protein
MSTEEITAMVTVITDVITILRTAEPAEPAEPADKVQLYAQPGLRLTYKPGPRPVIARAELGR